MKKLITGIISLLLLVSVIWAAATYWFGVKTELQYRILLQQAPQALQEVQYLKFVNESYDRGFFASQARTVLEIEHPQAAAERAPMRLILAHDITHGPFPISRSPEGAWQFKPVMAIIETKIIFDPDAQKELAKLFDQIPEILSMRDYTVIYPDGRGEEHFVIPAFQRTYGDENKVTVDWKGLFLQVDFTGDLKGFTGSMKIPGLEVAGRDLDLKMREMKYAFSVREGARGLWLGEASFDLGEINFANKEDSGPRAGLIRGVGVTVSGDESGDNVSYSLAARTDQVKVDESLYGPGIFKMEIRKIDAESLAKLQQAIREEQKLASGQSPEEVQRLVLLKYLEILPALLEKSPELEISRVEVKTPDGDFTGTAKIAVDGTKWDSSQDLSKLATTSTAKAELKAGERLVNRVASIMMKSQILAEIGNREGEAPSDEEVDTVASAAAVKQLDALSAQNILVKEDGNYSVNVSYNVGQIVLNGRPLALQDFMK